MKVTKRSGEQVPMLFDKVTKRISKLNQSPEFEILQVHPDKVAQKVFQSMYDGISTTEIDNLTAEVAVAMITEHPDYETLAMRVTVSNLQKNCPKTFSDAMVALHVKGIVSAEFMKCVRLELDAVIQPKRDYDFGYFGIKTLQRGYLNVGETPQYLFMRVAVGIHGDDLKRVKETYDLMSRKYFTHATPTLFNAGGERSQMSSCFLLSMAGDGDSIDGIFETLKRCAHISKWSGGIGIAVSSVRAKGSKIKGTNGESDGIVPMLRVFNNTARYVNQCFRGDTQVYSRRGPIPIDHVKVGDQLVTIDGTTKNVLGVVRNHVDKTVLNIRPMHSLEPVTVTPEHEIYTIQGQAMMLNHSTIKNRLVKKIIEPKFVSAGTLRKGDYVGFPVPREVVDFPETADYFRMYGIMIGDGYITKNGYECGVCLGTDKKMGTLNFVTKFLKERGLRTWFCHDEEKNTISVRWANNIDVLHVPIYDSHKEKHIDSRFLNLPRDKTLALVKGLMETDGGITHEVQFYNTSKNVVYSLRYMLLRLGVLTSGHYVGKTHEIRPGEFITNRRPSWSLRIPKHPALRPVFGDAISYSTTIKYFEHDGILWSRIRDISESHHEGYVYDLNMEENHNYLTDMGLVHNSGKRKGSIAVYLEPWHADVMEFLELRLNQGDEEMRCRDLFTALWIPDLFMEKVQADDEWYLMCPNESPGLQDVYGEAFNELYRMYVAQGRYKRKVRAREVWDAILKSQVETGTPYMSYKDAANEKTNQKNLGTIRCSNLCEEVYQYTDANEIAVCNLASICLPSFIEETAYGASDGSSGTERRFDFTNLHYVTEIVTRNLNRVIDKNYYPVPEAERSNRRHRPIGIGVQGLADVFQMLGLAFDSAEARDLNKRIFETIYRAALTASANLAAEEGPYETYEGSPASQGILQPDMWGLKLDTFDIVKEQIKRSGLRNSLLVAPMPTASTSQIMGNNECFEPYTTNIYLRRTLAGEFVVVNKHLVRDLTSLGKWNPQIKTEIVRAGGSVQGLDIPDKLKEIYRTVWEIPQKSIIEMAADRGPFIDQSQSMNIFMEDPTVAKLSSMHMFGWKKGLKTGMYYLRTRAKAKPIQVTVPVGQVPQKPTEEEKLACSLANPEGCLMCSG
jgi:ribonucleoside-diphosphate reductase alpha subunit